MCVYMSLSLGVHVSEVSKALLGQSAIVSRSGPLNSLGRVLKGKEDVLHFIHKAGEPSALFYFQA